MISYETALAKVLEGDATLPQQETFALLEAQGRYLANDIFAEVSVPNFKNSAMDGYAVRCAGITLQQSYLVSQRITAGDCAKELSAGTVARIFTGAMLPPNADAIILQEDTDVDVATNKVQFSDLPAVNQHIRRAGEDIKKGALLIARGERLNAAKIGLLASLGIGRVACFKRLKVAFFSTGDELLEPGQLLQAGKIYNSNRYALLAAVAALGAEPIDLGVCPDEPQATANMLLRASECADCVLTTGGMSVGDEDYVREQSQLLGDIAFWKIAIKPGKPFAFGCIGDTQFFGLPGNPVSAYVTFQLLVKPWLRKRGGAGRWLNQALVATAFFEYQNRSKRLEFLRGCIDYDGLGAVTVKIYPQQGSGVFSSINYANVLVPVAPNTMIVRGDCISVVSMD